MSVLLPCRDVAAWLPECIDSLESQSLRDFEVLAVDDRSSDGTGELLARWSARDHRVRVLETEAAEAREPSCTGSGSGLVQALGLAAAAAAAPLVARMDGDDVADPRRLERQRAFLTSRPEVAACGTGVELFPGPRVGHGYRRYEDWLNGLTTADRVNRDLFVECPVAHPTLMIRRSVLAALGGYRDSGWPEDYDLVLRLHAAGMQAANLDQVLLRWRVRPDRHSLTSERYGADAFRRCKAHFLDHVFLPSGRPLVLWGAGRVGKPLARELVRMGRSITAFVDLDPRKIGQEIHGARVLHPEEFATLCREAAPYVLAAVGSPGAREQIRASLASMGRTEIDDYRVCA